jgi:hypothetical protein
MKTNQDYQMFFQGYLEALTDIDGDQREFGVYVRMFNSSHKEHISDIEKEFGYKEPVEIIDSKRFGWQRAKYQSASVCPFPDKIMNKL